MPSAAPSSVIRIAGARQHNLRNLTLEIPRERMTVITGPSGCGKSSLAFDTLYAEGQRRYVESLSTQARQFLERLPKPDVDRIDGLSPAIAIGQQAGPSSPRATIATVTEIHDYLRLLFATAGQPHDPATGRPAIQRSPMQITEDLLSLPAGSRLLLLAPLAREQSGDHRDTLEKIRRQGFVRARVDGIIYDLSDLSAPLQLDATLPHTIEAVVDRLVLRENSPDLRPRLAESVETALKWGDGHLLALHQPSGAPAEAWNAVAHSIRHTSAETGFILNELSPRIFSFNSPLGACPRCQGIGSILFADAELLVPDPSLSLEQDAVPHWHRSNKKIASLHRHRLMALAVQNGLSPRVPFRDLPEKFRESLLNDLLREIEHLHDTSESELARRRLRRLLREQVCPVCAGNRLRPELLAVTLTSSAAVPASFPVPQPLAPPGLGIHQLCALTITQAAGFLEGVELSPARAVLCADILRELLGRLRLLEHIGLGYLTLDRRSDSLSGGEFQRIRLATQIGGGLSGVLYILDEPSIGLHPRDTRRLLDILRQLRDLGNTLVVVEHDPDTIAAADWLIEIGPGAGPLGGHLLSSGPPAGGSFWPSAAPSVRAVRSSPHKIVIHGATANNLKDITVALPLGQFICVTGVSGSGKSTLVDDILRRALARHFHHSRQPVGAHRHLSGLEHIDQFVVIDQTPIGRSPRSNPATAAGLFGPLRDLFAQLPLARLRGYNSSRFSFNLKGGRCEHCQGEGQIKIDMGFLADRHTPCEACGGRRYNRETLEVTWKGRSIADLLELDIDSAAELLRAVPAISDKLRTLQEVGLGYLRLGQSSHTLSGGEAQRVKLAAELARRDSGRSLYLLDEPTTGLHSTDVQNLLALLFRLRDKGNTVLVVEHHVEVMRGADWIVDLGPEAGEGGGYLVAEGTPEEVSRCGESLTAPYLAAAL